ncbi:hypothetical protein GJ699_23300 [Duganella sp. FT80W]|uniref:Uncharacterized protein n=1 Tax=Duganella guangzhouensis TaxID=2666084 RepID=A0A6I2L9H5_9BURK|nr:hypothetical protein [Duganella guangzhouensis]MRW92929.1 hypothetical protein [Duganella guangzhouensis]
MKTFYAALLLLLSLSAWAEDSCMRSEAEPMFTPHQPGLRNYQFKRLSATEAQESFQLASGESVLLEHGGCEYFVTKFRFSSPAILKQGATRKQAFASAGQLLRRLRLLKGDSAFDLLLAARTLETAVQRKPDVEYGESQDVEGDGEDFLQTQAQLVAAGPGFVQLMLFKGPL